MIGMDDGHLLHCGGLWVAGVASGNANGRPLCRTDDNEIGCEAPF